MACDRFPCAAVATLMLALAVVPPTAAVDAPVEEESAELEIGRPTWPFFLRFSWDAGLVYQVGSPIHGPEWLPDDLWLRKEDVIVGGRAGFRLHLDAAAFASSGDAPHIDPKADVRRSFFYLRGGIRLRQPIRYRFEFGVVRGRAYLDSGWFEAPGLVGPFTLRIGQFTAPMSLERLTSSNVTTFMEVAAPVDAFSPGIKGGIQVSALAPKGRATWSFGWFADTQESDVGDASDSLARLTTRTTWLPSWWDDPAAGHLVHIGLSAQFALSADEGIRYDARPESFLAPTLLDTGDLDTTGASLAGAELAVLRGATIIQAEWLGAYLDADPGGATEFWGGYVSVSRLLTGEVRPYDRAEAVFGMIEPHRPMWPWGTGWGACEVGLRYSRLDLVDAAVRGGDSHALALAGNWHWSRHLRVMASYGWNDISRRADAGDVHVFQTRFQIVY